MFVLNLQTYQFINLFWVNSIFYLARFSSRFESEIKSFTYKQKLVGMLKDKSSKIIYIHNKWLRNTQNKTI